MILKKICNKYCIVCGKDISHTYKNTKVCSPICRTKYHYRKKLNRPISNIEFKKSLIIKCIICGKEIQAKQNNKQCCSSTCMDKYSQRKQYNLPLSNKEYNKLLYKKCAYCGKNYIAGHAFSKTCSNNCACALYRKTKRKPIIRKWTINKLRNDINYKIISYLRNRIRSVLNNKNNKTIELLGCDLNTLKQWLGIIDNYSGKRYHLDHIIPISLYSIEKESEQFKAFNYKNLRLIPAKNNLKKSNHLDLELVKLLKIENLLPEGINVYN